MSRWNSTNHIQYDIQLFQEQAGKAAIGEVSDLITWQLISAVYPYYYY